MIDITAIFQAAILLIFAVISGFVIPWIRAKTTDVNTAELEKWVNIAVQAAEQLFIGSGRGAEKKDYVIKFLESHGLTADFKAIEALIESAVHDLNSGMVNAPVKASTKEQIKFNISK